MFDILNKQPKLEQENLFDDKGEKIMTSEIKEELEEIKEETAVECEGSEPNTCADCMPLDFEFIRYCKARNNAGLNNLSVKEEKPCQRAKNGLNGGVYGN